LSGSQSYVQVFVTVGGNSVYGSQPLAKVGKPLDEQIKVEIPDSFHIEHTVTDYLLAF
jgi:phage tail protein X